MGCLASTQADDKRPTLTGVSASPVLVAQLSPVAASKEAGKARAAVVQAAVAEAASVMDYAGVLRTGTGGTRNHSSKFRCTQACTAATAGVSSNTCACTCLKPQPGAA